jgi:hypothetical protein
MAGTLSGLKPEHRQYTPLLLGRGLDVESRGGERGVAGALLYDARVNAAAGELSQPIAAPSVTTRRRCRQRRREVGEEVRESVGPARAEDERGRQPRTPISAGAGTLSRWYYDY